MSQTDEVFPDEGGDRPNQSSQSTRSQISVKPGARSLSAKRKKKRDAAAAMEEAATYVKQYAIYRV